MVYYNYRYYSPGLGRWLSRDPIEEQGGWNLYNMCGNNPVNYWDWLGQDFWDSTVRVINNMMIGMTTGATTGVLIGGTAGSAVFGVGAIPGAGAGAVAGGIGGLTNGAITGIMSELSGGNEQQAYMSSAKGGAVIGSTGSLGAAATKASKTVDVGGKAASALTTAAVAAGGITAAASDYSSNKNPGSALVSGLLGLALGKASSLNSDTISKPTLAKALANLDFSLWSELLSNFLNPCND